jgi:hypothetical protein
MDIEIILMTKSRKHKNYCIAGIDVDTGKWIRLISENSSIHCAVPEEDLTYEDGSQANILDVVRVTLKKKDPLHFQPENVIYDSQYYWTKLRTATLSDVIEILDQAEDEYVFLNAEKKLKKSFVDDLSADEVYSLKFICVDEATLYAKRWDDQSNIKYTLSFDYNDERYSYLSITDDYFTRNFTEEGEFDLDNICLVISLGELYEKDECHYKLIASVFTEGLN